MARTIGSMVDQEVHANVSELVATLACGAGRMSGMFRYTPREGLADLAEELED